MSRRPYNDPPTETAGYLSLRKHRSLSSQVWAYRHPLRDAEEVAGLLCFYEERVGIDVDDDG